MAIFCGARDGDGLSDYYKAYITQSIGGQEVTVVGYVSEETVITLSQRWNSPFEGETAGNQSGLQVASGLGQDQTELTSVSLLNSKLIWEGADPISFNMKLQFYAYADAFKEVEQPVRFLKQMSSPELNEATPFGQRPQAAMLDLGRKMVTPVLLSEVSYDTNAPKTSDGYFAYNTVDVQCSINGSLNASQIPPIFR